MPIITVIPTPTVPLVPRIAPASVDIDKIDVHSSLIPLGLRADHTMVTPDDPHQASYYCIVDPTRICSSGVLPGQVGPAVIIGHIDGNKQKGVFHDLPQLARGDIARVTLQDGTKLTFMVYRTLQQAKTAFPAQVVYQATSVPEVRFVTCTGKFVGGHVGYADNFIVFASLVPNAPGD